MALILARRDRALSLFESVLALLAVLLVTYLVAVRLEAVAATVEKARLRAAVTSLDTTLKVEAAVRLMRGDAAALAALDRANPMHLGLPGKASGSEASARESRSYAGEFDAPDPADIEAGTWYFDTATAYLIYRVDSAGHFESPLDGAPRARFQVRLRFVDKDGDGRFSPGVDKFRGVGLDPVEPFGWNF